MLDDYKEEQNIVYQILKNAIHGNRLSHAYLIETNEYISKFSFALSIAKMLLCPSHYSNNKNCNNCHQCENIDKNCFSEIKIIEPEGLWIKKEQIDQLKMEFSRTSIESKQKVYIINQAEKLNPSAANTLLKFLEEPEKGIIAILLTDNIYQMMETIISRCQILSLKKQKVQYETLEQKISLFINIPSIVLENFDIYINTIINFIVHFEKYGNETILNTNKLWHDIIKTREEILFALDVIILYYKDIINKKISREILLFENNENFMYIVDKNTIENLNYKIQIIFQAKEYVKLNANANLLIDKLVIDMKRGV